MIYCNCDATHATAQKMKFSIKGFFGNWSHLLKKSLVENVIFLCIAHHLGYVNLILHD